MTKYKIKVWGDDKRALFESKDNDPEDMGKKLMKWLKKLE